jgi:phytoene dehydrogenase-like protein
MDNYDAVIIGAGHNGLICATYLAMSGKRVLVLEANDQMGGLSAEREFHPGFKATVAHTVSHFSAEIVKGLELQKHGLAITSEPLSTVGLDQQGNHIYVDATGIKGTDEQDAISYQEYCRLLNRFADALKPFWLKTIPDIGINSLQQLIRFGHIGWNLRSMGKDDMREFLRVITLPTRDLMDENFNNELLKAVLSWDGLIGSRLAPRSPNSAVLAILYRMAGNFNGQRNSHIIPKGGMAGLIQALVNAAQSAGVEIKTAAPVERVIVEGSDLGPVASGVQLGGGEIIKADTIISNADPRRTFVDLVGVKHLEIEFSQRIKRLRCDGYVAKLHLALDDLPEFTGLDIPNNRMIIAPTMDAIEFAYDDSKYGDFSSEPVMEMIIPTLHDESLAPSGKHILSAHVMYVPYKLNSAGNDEAHNDFMDRVIDKIALYAPDIREKILHRELLTPMDLEQQYNVTGGHWHHAELALDQMLMMRPTYEAGQYQTPIGSLYLCGAGCHPGGGIMGGPGHNAAKTILANKSVSSGSARSDSR